jgi:hypothetical protein
MLMISDLFLQDRLAAELFVQGAADVQCCMLCPNIEAFLLVPTENRTLRALLH